MRNENWLSANAASKQSGGISSATAQLRSRCFQGSWRTGQIRTEIDYRDHRVGASALWRTCYSHQNSPRQVSRPPKIAHKGACAQEAYRFLSSMPIQEPELSLALL